MTDELKGITVYPCYTCGRYLSGSEEDVRAHLAMPILDEVPKGFFYIDRALTREGYEVYRLVIDKKDPDQAVLRADNDSALLRILNLKDPSLHATRVLEMELHYDGKELFFEPKTHISALGQWNYSTDVKEFIVNPEHRGDFLSDDEFERVMSRIRNEQYAFSDFPFDDFVNSLEGSAVSV